MQTDQLSGSQSSATSHTGLPSRLGFIRQALAAGLSVPTVAALLQEIEGPVPVHAAGAPPVQITFSSWGSLDEQVTITALLKVFEERHKNIQVQPLLTSWSSYWPKYTADLAAQSTADVQFLTFVPTYASKGALSEIRPLLRKHGQTVPTAYTPGLLSLFEYKNKLYGYPRDNGTEVIFYNKTLFRQAGVPFPTATWTWDDLRSKALKLTKRHGKRVTQYGFAFETFHWRLYIWQSGTELFDSNSAPTKVTFNTPAAAQALQFMADLITKDKVTPPASQIADSSAIGPLFSSGRLAMAFGNHALVPTFVATPGLEWGVVGLPHFAGQPTVNEAGGAGYVISRWTQQPEAAFQLWSFLVGPVASQMFAAGNDLVPVNPQVLRSATWLSKPYNRVFSEQTALGHAFPSFAAFNDIYTVITTVLDRVWIGEMTAAQALPQAASSAAKMLHAAP